MSLLALYARVLGELGPEKRLGVVLALANILLAAVAFAEPMLFVQGSRDAFGTADEIRALLPKLQHATLHEVPGGDHSFKVSGRGAPKPDAVLDSILDVVKDWIATRT